MSVRKKEGGVGVKDVDIKLRNEIVEALGKIFPSEKIVMQVDAEKRMQKLFDEKNINIGVGLLSFKEKMEVSCISLGLIEQEIVTKDVIKLLSDGVPNKIKKMSGDKELKMDNSLDKAKLNSLVKWIKENFPYTDVKFLKRGISIRDRMFNVKLVFVNIILRQTEKTNFIFGQLQFLETSSKEVVIERMPEQIAATKSFSVDKKTANSKDRSYVYVNNVTDEDFIEILKHHNWGLS